MTTDQEAWIRYTQHRWVFNKLELALRLNYNAAPSGVPVPHQDKYIVRPIYNLNGMGAGAFAPRLTPINCDIPPGYFWSEFFTGDHLSVDFKWSCTGALIPILACKGTNNSNTLYRFSKWERVFIRTDHLEIPEWIQEFRDVDTLNIEFIGGKIIEIHLRGSSDFPKNAKEIIPIWKDTPATYAKELVNNGYRFVKNSDNSSGYIPNNRIGFMYK